MQTIAAPAIAAVMAIAVSALTLLLTGNDPIDAARAMWNQINGTDAMVDAINSAGPYYVSGLAAAIGFKMSLFNIGVEGQYRIGAFFAAVIGAKMSLPAVLHLPAILVLAMVFGATWAAVPAVLNVKANVNIVISTIMLNSIATALTAYLLFNYFRYKQSAGDLVPRTKPIPRSGWMPHLNRPIEAIGFHFPANTRLHGYLVLAIVVGIVFYVIVWRTRFGFDLRSSGVSPDAARAAGVDPKRMVVITMLMSGALAGLVGMGQMLSSGHVFGDQFPTGLGFAGIAVALLGRNHPAGIAFAAFIWSAIETAALGLSDVGIPQEITRILQGSLLLSAVIAYEVVRRRRAVAMLHEAAHAVVSPGPVGATA
jgi:simple sugar transport system permease protein